MKRYFALAAAFCCIALIALLRTDPAPKHTTPISWDVPVTELHASEHFTQALLRGPSLPLQPDSLSSDEVTAHIGRLYGYQSDIVRARRAGRSDRIDALFDHALRTLDTLMRRPKLTRQRRFREAYRSLVTEYEDYYGVPDTLSLPQGNIFRARSYIFDAISSASPTPSLTDVDTAAFRPQPTTVPLPYNGYVRSALAYLQRTPEKHVYHWLQRKETYFPMIEDIFAKQGVPDELKYLAMVESGLNPSTKSWAGAAGLWQFMPSTGRAYGLTVNPWVDERLDPVKATRAAARHLKDLYRLFDGNWLLALSGYNCSPTRIRKAMRTARSQGKKPTFWNIYPYIPRETRNYVPTFVASALMVSNPQSFDLKRVSPGPRFQFDYVPIKGMLSLRTLAKLAGTDVDRLRALNPELRRATLPPSSDPYYVRIPYGRFDQFVKRYNKLPEAKKNGLITHTVRPGEMISDIAKRFKVSVDRIVQLNNLKSAMLQAGDKLAIPAPRYDGNAELLTEADAAPLRVRYSNRSVRPLAGSGAPGSNLAGERLTMHRVKPGDTLSEIAHTYGVTIAQIKDWNNLHSNRLSRGQRLQVYGG